MDPTAPDPIALEALEVDAEEVADAVAALGRSTADSDRRARLLEVVGYLDLTSLRGDETEAEVRALCARARRPLGGGPEEDAGMSAAGGAVATVCVLPHAASIAVEALRGTPVRVACAAGDFPTARAPLTDRVAEIRRAVADGAHEIDAVVQRDSIRSGAWAALDEEVRALKRACGAARLKAILGTGELELTEVARASRIALAAGADFIKTSTGKDRVNATLPAGVVMAREIRRHFARTGARAGLKPAGGVRTAADALGWLALADTQLGPEWRSPECFRIGASALLDDLARALAAAD